jgi:hypothetical protein
MSFVTTQPEALAAAAPTLQGIGSSISAQTAAAAPATTGVIPTAGDEVSALTAPQFATLRHIRPSASKRLRFTRCS